MESPMKHESNAVPVYNSVEEVELEDEHELLVKRRRTEFSAPILQPRQETEVSDMAIQVPDGLPVEEPTGGDPMDVVTACAVQSSGEANGSSKKHACNMSFTGNEPARVRLPKMCAAIGWKEPSFEFEEQGPPHNRLFTCKVTVHIDGLTNTVMECSGGPSRKKKDTQEHAAQGALWCLGHLGHAKVK